MRDVSLAGLNAPLTMQIYTFIFKLQTKHGKNYHFLQKLALQRQKEECHQARSAARQRATPQVLSAQLQWKADCRFHETDQFEVDAD